jgi:hypothetical protein
VAQEICREKALSRSSVSHAAKTIAALVWAVCALGPPVFAADYVAQPIASAVALNATPKISDSGLTVEGLVTQEGSYESNPLLLIGGGKALYGSTTSPELIIKDSTLDTQISADTIIDGNAFNQSTFNSVDFHSVAGIQGGNERWNAGIQENTDYDTTRTSELSNFNLSSRPFRHTQFQLTPQGSFSPTDIDKLSLLGNYTTSQYQSSLFSDYEVYGITPTYVHNVDPRNAAVFAVQTQHYETTSNAVSKTDSIGPSVGWITALTPEFTAKATGGVITAKQSGAGVTNGSWDLHYIFSADITYTGKVDTLSLEASRQEYPLGNGAEDLLTAISINNDHKINDNLLFDLGASYATSTYQTTANGNLQTQYSVNGGLTYAISNRVDVKGTYQYRYETLSGISGSAQDHLFNVALVYRFDTRSF